MRKVAQHAMMRAIRDWFCAILAMVEYVNAILGMSDDMGVPLKSGGIVGCRCCNGCCIGCGGCIACRLDASLLDEGSNQSHRDRSRIVSGHVGLWVAGESLRVVVGDVVGKGVRDVRHGLSLRGLSQ